MEPTNPQLPIEPLTPDLQPQVPEQHKKRTKAFFVASIVAGYLLVGLGIFGFIKYRQYQNSRPKSEQVAQQEKKSSTKNKKQSTQKPNSQTTTKSGSSNNLLPYPTGISPDNIKFTNNDKKRIGDIEAMSVELLIYTANHQGSYPANARDASFINKDQRKDPQTKKPYVLVDSKPKRGDVQYVLSAGCTDAYRAIERIANTTEYNNKGLWAMAVMLDDGSLLCKSNGFSD